MNNWIADDIGSLPDFIIGGAMKCGTSTLHTILSKHPKIFIPKEEVHFFDMDNILQHSDFNFYYDGEWTIQEMDKNPKQVWEWYQSKFKGKEDFIKGEDSTTYLASRIAAERISIQKKKIKIVFLLRQPSLRAYSNYHHLLRSGKATHSFEDTLRFSPYRVLCRSLYKEQLENYYRYLPKDRIKVVLFEDLINSTETIVKEICEFINVDFKEIPSEAFKMYSNKGSTPRNSKLHAKKNMILRNLGNSQYQNNLPFTNPNINESNSLISSGLNKLHSIINPQAPITSKIKKETKEFLDNFFFEELKGINELVDKDILTRWFPQKNISRTHNQ